MKTPKLYTIGHSNKPIAELVNKLKENKIEFLVDCRSIPYSRRNPQFNREAMIGTLTEAKIKYLYRGKNLGGKGGKEANTDWGKAIDEVVKAVKNGKKVCVMCSEADPNECHRQSTIQPDVEAKGVDVEHILWKPAKVKANSKDGKAEQASLFD